VELVIARQDEQTVPRRVPVAADAAARGVGGLRFFGGRGFGDSARGQAGDLVDGETASHLKDGRREEGVGGKGEGRAEAGSGKDAERSLAN
jgi:hypothetical protein